VLRYEKISKETADTFMEKDEEKDM